MNIKLPLLIASWLIVISHISGQIPVTFNVDMTGQTINANGVHLAGNFNDPNYDGTAENSAYTNWNPAGIALAHFKPLTLANYRWGVT